MNKIPLSQFKSNCDTILEDVNQTHKSVVITQNGKLLAKISPILSTDQESWLGCMKETGKVLGDIISPAEDIEAWEALEQ